MNGDVQILLAVDLLAKKATANFKVERRSFAEAERWKMNTVHPGDGKQNSRKSDTFPKKLDVGKYRRIPFNQKPEPRNSSDAFHDTYWMKTRPFELHHNKKNRIELTNKNESGKTKLPEWSYVRIYFRT